MQGVITKLLYFLSLSPFNLQAESWENPNISDDSSQILNKTSISFTVQRNGQGKENQLQNSHFLTKREVKKKPESMDLTWLHVPVFGMFSSLFGLGITIVGLFLISENETIRFLFKFAAFDYIFSMVLSFLRIYTEKVREKDLDRLLGEISMEMEDFGSKVATAALIAKIYFDIFPPQPPTNGNGNGITMTNNNNDVLPSSGSSESSVAPKLFRHYANVQTN